MAIPYMSYIGWNVLGIRIESFGVLIAIAFLITILIASYEAKRKGLNKEAAYDIGFWIIVWSIIGSRIVYVLGNLEKFDSIIEMLKFWDGGLTFYGGFIFAVGFCLIYLYIKKFSFFSYSDCAALGLPLGHFFGRIGCILGDGGHAGKVTNLPFGVIVGNSVRHLTAAYEAVGLLLLFFVILKIRKKKMFRGFYFLLYCLMYGVMRFFIEFLRVEKLYYGLTGSQWFSILLVIVCGSLIIYKLRKRNEI